MNLYQVFHKEYGDRLEDTPPTPVQTEILDSLGQYDRWLVVPDTGSDVLLDLKFIFERYLKTGSLIVPYEWATRKSEERSLCQCRMERFWSIQ